MTVFLVLLNVPIIILYIYYIYKIHNNNINLCSVKTVKSSGIDEKKTGLLIWYSPVKDQAT